MACLDSQKSEGRSGSFISFFLSARKMLTLNLILSNRHMDLLNGCSPLIILKLNYLNLSVTIMYAEEMGLTIYGS